GLPHSALTCNDRPSFDTSGFSRDGLSRSCLSRLKPLLQEQIARKNAAQQEAIALSRSTCPG
ncbi:hypothetical protein J7370_01920, partial [Xanthomonas sp. D-93]|uniref:hypothetical protein n=1 Tax=Xanthomonas sp. D-93 TaxID=2821272 RepID=UPI001ADBF008